MENTNVIMIEGLPGTGKPTNSYFLSMQLDCDEKNVKWIHEVARPHPVLFFDEASLTYEEFNYILNEYPRATPILNKIAMFRKESIGFDLLELEWNYINQISKNVYEYLRKYDVMKFSLDKYMSVALEKWAYFTVKALENKDEIYILDSAIFQYQIFTFLLKNAPYKEIEQFMQKLLQIIKPLNPNLVYFYRENSHDTISFLENLRGKQFLANIWERDKTQPYYSNKPRGAEGHKQFLMDYANIAKKLFNIAECRKTSIEITKQDWETYENEILSFLGVERKSYPNAIPSNGVFRNVTLDQEIEVCGLSIKDPYGKERILTPKSECEFYVECLPVILRFNGSGQIVILGGQILDQWTTSGTLFERV